jgi:hypothetical protein
VKKVANHGTSYESAQVNNVGLHLYPPPWPHSVWEIHVPRQIRKHCHDAMQSVPECDAAGLVAGNGGEYTVKNKSRAKVHE